MYLLNGLVAIFNIVIYLNGLSPFLWDAIYKKQSFIINKIRFESNYFLS